MTIFLIFIYFILFNHINHINYFNYKYRILDPSFRYGTANMPEEEKEFEAKVKMLRELETNAKGITKLMRKSRRDDALEKSLSYFVTADVAQFFTTDQMTYEEELAEQNRKLKEQQMLEGNVKTNWDVVAVVDEDQL